MALGDIEMPKEVSPQSVFEKNNEENGQPTKLHLLSHFPLGFSVAIMTQAQQSVWHAIGCRGTTGKGIKVVMTALWSGLRGICCAVWCNLQFELNYRTPPCHNSP